MEELTETAPSQSLATISHIHSTAINLSDEDMLKIARGGHLPDHLDNFTAHGTRYRHLKIEGDRILWLVASLILTDLFGEDMLHHRYVLDNLVGNDSLAKQAALIGLDTRSYSSNPLEGSAHSTRNGQWGDNYEAYIALLYYHRGGLQTVMDFIRPWVESQSLQLIESEEASDPVALAYYRLHQRFKVRPAIKTSRYYNKPHGYHLYNCTISIPTKDGWSGFIVGKSCDQYDHRRVKEKAARKALDWLDKHPLPIPKEQQQFKRQPR